MSTEPSATQGGEAPSTGSADSGEQPVRQWRQWLRGWSVIAVATAVLVAGGGGAWWASTAGWGSTGGGARGPGTAPKPPKLALDGFTTGAQSGADGGDQSGIAPGEPHPQRYRADGKLPDGPGTAAVYRNPGTVQRASVAALAKALGVEGKPERRERRWVVGEDENAPGGTALTVNDERLAGNWTYHSGDQGMLACAKPPPGSTAWEAPQPTVPRTPVAPPERGEVRPDSCPAMPSSGKGEPVSEKQAKRAVRPLLKTLKLQDARLDAGVTTGPLRMVTATPKVDGMRAQDWNSTFTVDGDGKVVRGHGNLGELRKGASYPVMSAKETLGQLNKQGSMSPGLGLGLGPRPGPDSGGAEPQQAAPGEAPAPGRGAPRKALKVTGAEFGLATRYSVGKPMLVPSWIYEVRLGGGHTAHIAYPAVEPRYLKPVRAAHPGPRPEPGSGRPDSGARAGSGAGPGHSGTGRQPGSAPAQAVNSYTADGRTLKLTFWGGVCGGYRASAEESAKSVTVTVRPQETDPKKVCVKMAERRTVEVELDKALGDREVVDGADGDSLPRK